MGTLLAACDLVMHGVTNGDGWTPRHLASSIGALLKMGAAENTMGRIRKPSTRNGTRHFIWLPSSGGRDAMRLLIEAGASVNAKDGSGERQSLT